MPQSTWKIRDKVTGKFWTGNPRNVTFNSSGKSWKKKEHAENRMAYYLTWKDSWGNTNNFPNVESWEIVEMEIKEVEKTTYEIGDFIYFQKVRSKASEIDHSFGYFLDTMWNKGVYQDIEFLFKLKPGEGHRWVKMEQIKACRADLRRIGIKTRTFREQGGVFGMMDRQQALKARIVLDIENSADLTEIRNSIK